ncbi:MAG: response regulator [Kiritimatiellae bacterium]|nr:response regulator [Kiritimatiellia bacterium]
MKAARRHSIHTQVLGATLLAALLPLIFFLAGTEFMAYQALIRGEMRVLRMLVRVAGHQIGYVMQRASADLQLLASNPAWSLPGADVDLLLRDMQQIKTMSRLFADITVYDREGGVIASSSYENWESEHYTDCFRQALEGRSGISPPGRIIGQEGLFLRFFAPIPGADGKTRYVLTARCPFDRVSETLRGLRLGQQGYLLLLDTHGNVLEHPDPDRVLQKFDASHPASFWAGSPQGFYREPGGARHAYAAMVLGPDHIGASSPWILVGLRPYAEILAPLWKGLLLLGGMVFLTLAIVYLLGSLQSRRLARPIVEAASAAQRVSRGDLAVTVPEKGPREIRNLAEAFNRMIREVRQSRSELETLVEQRTGRLHESQQRLEQISAHLRAAYESITDGLLMAEWPSGRILTANQRFSDLFELAPHTISGTTLEHLEDLLRGKLAAGARDMFRTRKFADNPADISVEEWEIVAPRRQTLSVYSAPATGPGGEVFARLWMFRDLTRQRQLEEELRQAQKMEAIGRLAGGIAHDFNNLLTGILGNLSMADMELGRTSGLRQYLEPARQAARRAAELVNQLLGFSRRSTLRVQACSVNRIAREIHELLRHTVHANIEFRLELQTDLWDISADASQIHQVLMNLSMNAVDAMPRGGRLTLRTRNMRIERDEARQWLDAREGDFVKITVEDTGHGMTPEVQRHLFEPFFTTKGPGRGTGLGLAMSYGIVKQHGGWITCVSQVNQGTNFSLYLARLTEPAGAAPPPAAEPAVRGGRERLLVVDDEMAVREIVRVILQRWGYTVEEAADGPEALRLIEARPPDLILLDLTMPELSGLETLRRLRRLAPRVPVIISSGYVLEAGAPELDPAIAPQGIVQKPFEALALARTVREVLDRAAAPPA